MLCLTRKLNESIVLIEHDQVIATVTLRHVDLPRNLVLLQFDGEPEIPLRLRHTLSLMHPRTQKSLATVSLVRLAVGKQTASLGFEADRSIGIYRSELVDTSLVSADQPEKKIGHRLDFVI